jgi:hypothetical protein
LYDSIILNETPRSDYRIETVTPTYIIDGKNFYYHEVIQLGGEAWYKQIYLGNSPIFESYDSFDAVASQTSMFDNGIVKVLDSLKYQEQRKNSIFNGIAVESPNMGDCKYEFRFSNYLNFNRM